MRVRAAALARRDALGDEARIEASLTVAGLLGEALDFDPGTIVSGFLPIRSEIDLRPLMARLADRGARLCVPAIVGGELEFRQLVRGEPLVPQGFGTLAPGEGAAVLDPQLMLVPLSAFDRRCHRIGYGRGYYDRAIEAIRRRGGAPRLVGVAFAAQEVETVPTEDHDVALDMIATEAGLVRPA
ncbi:MULTISPECIES: 5-formyltetrahydrofolate cyclo-ligase [unclassified Aureimonas]|uniref:5-formyltetrahydrofolate cyclo-ligase n=1 Tax=unclassified Aureimonas TaxID=2615206 RepID=UPI001FCD88D0|nr:MULTISPECIES: 5-formyltetrahydrofolate cyclo-ligase [unclassified Aureimonas]